MIKKTDYQLNNLNKYISIGFFPADLTQDETRRLISSINLIFKEYRNVLPRFRKNAIINGQFLTVKRSLAKSLIPKLIKLEQLALQIRDPLFFNGRYCSYGLKYSTLYILD